MQKQTLTLLIGALVLVAGGTLAVPALLADDTPMVKWSAKDEVEVPTEPVDPATVGEESASVERSAAALPESGGANDERVDVVVRGRVVDKFKAPIASATVWLDYGRGGARGGPGGPGPGNNRQRRVPDPVTTDREGRFAFQGQTFRNLRVWLQVAHTTHAPGQFDKDVGSVAPEVDLGDLVLMSGGEVRGRVTDLDGIGIPGAELRLQPENNNAMRMLRDRDKLLPSFTTDQNGFYRRPNVAGGDWVVSATAKMHTEGRSNTFAVEEDQAVDVDDIRLGPGFEVTGYVRNTRGEPIAKADVVMQSDWRNRGNGRGRNGGPAASPGTTPPQVAPPTTGNGNNQPWGGQGFAFGREHRTTTDAQGRFFLEHLPGTTMQLQVDANGYLDYRQDGVDTTLGQPLQVAMQDGLRIEGRVQDGDGKPVALFAFRAIRVRGLPPPGQANIDFNAVANQFRSGTLDDATATQLREQFESMRGQFTRGRGPGGPGQDGGGRGGPGGPGGPGAARDLGKPERHADGTFVATGLQEGVYEVHVQSPEHARYHSAEVELRSGGAVPQLAITLDAGVYVAGVVLDNKGNPVRGAHVELRTPSAFEGLARGRGRNGGGRGAPGQPGAGEANVDFNGMAREFARMTAGTQLSLETTTNGEGVFIVKHAPRGTYRLAADAKGFSDATTETFELTGDRSGFELKLGSLGSIAGTVKGLRANEAGEARVSAVPLRNNGSDGNGGNGGGFAAMMGRGRGNGGGMFQSANVNADGTYRVDDLAPGSYVVRAWLGSPQELMRELGPQFMDGSLPADVEVRGGEESKLDLTALRPQVGTVAGTVTHNNAAAVGFQVELTRQDENGNGNGGNGVRGMRGPGGPGFGRSFQSAVAASGSFTIEKVPAGNYRLRVQSNRRGGALHEEIVQVLTDATTERSIVIQTYSLRGNVTRDDGGNVQDLVGRVTLLPGLTAMPENFGVYTRENPGFEARLRNGAFTFDTLRPGGYLLVASVSGRERVSMPIVVQTDQTLAVAAGKPTAAEGTNNANGNGAAPGANPPSSPRPNSGAPRRGNNGR